MRNQLTGLAYLTLRNLWATKTILALFVISTLLWIFLGLALQMETADGNLIGLRVFGQDAISPGELQQERLPGEEEAVAGAFLEQFVLGIESAVATLSYWIGTLLALFAVTPMFMALLSRGHVELLLSKPFSRNMLLGGHILGVLVMITALAVYLLGAVWLIMSIKSGIWNPSFLLAIPILIVMFGVMHSLIVLMGVLTDSTALALLTAYAVIFLSIILALHESIVPQLGTVGSTFFMAFYHVVPNFSEVTNILASLARNETVNTWYPLISSLVAGVACYALSAFALSRRDF